MLSNMNIPKKLGVSFLVIGIIVFLHDRSITPVNGVIDLSCKNTMVPIVPGSDVNNQCYIRPFIYTDLNLGVRVNDQFRFFFNIQNLTNARAPLAAAAYTSNPNYLSSWHYAGLVGRNFSAGANFNF